jgi:predicted DNA-binding transcriptional regulator AlpA
MDKLLRLAEVSDLLGVPVGTLRHWRYAGTGPRSARIGRNIVYRRGDVEQWVAEHFDGENPDDRGRITNDTGVA